MSTDNDATTPGGGPVHLAWRLTGAAAVVALLVASVVLPTARAEMLLECLRVLAWPVVAVVSAVLFRDRLAGLIGRLRTAEVPGGRLEFAEESISRIEQAAEDTQEAAADVERSVEAARAPDPALRRAEVVERFTRELRELRDQASRPSYREISMATLRTGRGGVPVSTVGGYFTGRSGLPSWDGLQMVVRALNGDVDYWRRRWTAAREELDRLRRSDVA